MARCARPLVSRPQPFPHAALPAISRDEIRATARFRAGADGFASVDAIASALSELAGETVAIALRRTRAFDPAHARSDGIAVAFAPTEEIGLGRAVLVDVEGALAATLVARALRQRAPKITDASRAARPEVIGAFAAVLLSALRRERALRIVAAGPAPALARDLGSVHGRIVSAWLTVTVGAEAFDARVSVPEALLPAGRAQRALDAKALDAMGDAPLALPVVLATCLAGRTTLTSLRAGDAFVLPSFPLEVGARGQLVGRVALVPAGAERGLGATLGDDGRGMLGSGPLENFPWDVPIGEAMSAEPNPTLEVIEDAPLVVRVELGTLEMPAREWAALAPGDVVTLGRKLGDPAILRVGGVEIARGELVQVDGEYGVRILGRAGGNG
jgi:flagellar motor switch/type III secretory pathway protein FliN